MLAVLERCRLEGEDSSLVSLTFVLARWLFIEGHWSDLETWSSHAIDAALRVGDLHFAARLWAERGCMLSHRSQFRKADYAFSQSLILASADPPDIQTVGYLKHHMGETRIRNKHYAEARELLEESKACFKRYAAGAAPSASTTVLRSLRSKKEISTKHGLASSRELRSPSTRNGSVWKGCTGVSLASSKSVGVRRISRKRATSSNAEPA